jgi:bacillithiol synthase
MMADEAVRLAAPGFALHVRPLPGGPIVRDYVAGRDLSAFFSGHWSDPAAYERKAAEVDARMSAASRMLVAPAIEPLGDAAPSLQRILSGDGYFVTTGQQPALFGGPLYTLYKILGAIRHAETLERRLGRPVLALFWVGSDDHDWDEANHAAVLDGAHYVRRIDVRAADDVPPLPLYQRTWGGDVRRAVEEFTTLLPHTRDARMIAEHVREHYTPGAAVSASFIATLRLLLADRRLALVDSSHPTLRAAAVPVIQREIENHARHHDALAAQTRRLESAGYRAQVTISDDAANLMRIDEHGRDRLVRTAKGWTTRRSAGAITDAVLMRAIERDPGSFSPNVLLRPVVEAAVFPTLAYVAGPGELSYLAQIGCLFEAHGVMAPLPVPRPSLTIVDDKVGRKLDRLGLTTDMLARPFGDIVSDLVTASMPAAVTGELASVRDQLMRRYEALASAADSVDPTLRGPIIAARNRALLETNALEKKIAAGLRRRNADAIEQIRRLAAALRPGGAPQERTFGALPFVAAYGRRVIDEAATAIAMDPSPAASWSGPECE